MIKRVTILESDDFGDELFSDVQELIIDMIENRNARVFTAGGDTQNMIYRLFGSLSHRYPNVIFTVKLSHDIPAYGDSLNLFSLDCELCNSNNAKNERDRQLLKNADILICRSDSKYASMAKDINSSIEVITV